MYPTVFAYIYNNTSSGERSFQVPIPSDKRVYSLQLTATYVLLFLFLSSSATES